MCALRLWNFFAEAVLQEPIESPWRWCARQALRLILIVTCLVLLARKTWWQIVIFLGAGVVVVVAVVVVAVVVVVVIVVDVLPTVELTVCWTLDGPWSATAPAVTAPAVTSNTNASTVRILLAIEPPPVGLGWKSPGRRV
jgi:ascorbate-specific PTS system EIIC-type component UlaA